METVLTVLLVRFGIIAAALVVLGLGVLGVVLVLRRHGRGEQARRLVEFAARQAAETRRWRR
ncbi:hypothetical protein HFP15_35485 [Amycolatopsis sp. K13G38]|uniref:Uncharacterized protein n=1 Tax=Amycolatopsis acididurans TaxID=2724524 RepID=A0ABX1JHC2_9PSEU|nr:hypothetical protein [Amycolatopsis acididurans]NKQ58175.1 hypothetical protein [Amycolatopsis acididurans]